jgi:hypothetical protein
MKRAVVVVDVERTGAVVKAVARDSRGKRVTMEESFMVCVDR